MLDEVTDRGRGQIVYSVSKSGKNPEIKGITDKIRKSTLGEQWWEG